MTVVMIDENFADDDDCDDESVVCGGGDHHQLMIESRPSYFEVQHNQSVILKAQQRTENSSFGQCSG